MPPKKPAADSPDPPAQSSGDAPAKEKKADTAALRKLAAHPSTAIMVKEALKALDSRKGVSSQAIQSYIKQKYPTVDLVRLKHFVRRALKKGIETGTLVRPANSNVTTGAMGKFRLAPKVKETKPKTENTDPNVQKAPKAKDGAKKPKKAGAPKKDTVNDQPKSQEDSKPPKKSKKAEMAATSKAAPLKKPKEKKATENGNAKEAATSAKPEAATSAKPEAATSAKPKAAKATKGVKAGRVTQSKAAKAGSDAPATKTGKGGKKSAD